MSIGLIAAAHVQAFLLAPRAYLTATWWRLRGKKLRARYQFAPLLARSRWAYDLWLLRNPLPAAARPAALSFTALVDAQGDKEAVAETLRSLDASGVTYRLIGGDGAAGLVEAADSIDFAATPWLLPMRAGDRLHAGAAALYQAAIDALAPGSDTRLIYADDDLAGPRGRRIAPHFKPQWNAELFRHSDYISGAALLRADGADMRSVAGAQDWVRRLTTLAAARSGGRGHAQHLPYILHQRAARPAPALAPPPEHAGDWPGVSVIVPTRNRVDLLHTCIAGLRATDYPDLHVIIVDNDSDDPATLAFLAELDPATFTVLRHPGPFNYSAINNRAAAQARGRFLCLLNNDIEMLQPDWLKLMVAQAMREDVGAVGAQLLYPDGRIQHAGVVTGVGNAAGHAHRFVMPEAEGYFHRHALPQFTSAVTAACLVVARDRFLAVGGLDEQRFAVAFNDVDLCLRLNQRGWQSFYEPRARLIHHESVSRGFDRDPVGARRFAGELAALQERWGTDHSVDPFHHPKLSRASETFVFAL